MDTRSPITPIESYPDLAGTVGVPMLYFKREDLHPYGSHKGRSIPAMIAAYASQDDRHFAVSGSGNASLAAALYVHEYNADHANHDQLRLDIFVGQHIAPHKDARLRALVAQTPGISVTLKERPLQALAAAVSEGARSLRQSTDDTALAGYASLAAELGETPGIGAVMIATSSGTTAQALAQFFAAQSRQIQVHIVQTSSCHPIAEEYDSYDGPEEISIADAIVDKTAHRKAALMSAIAETGGRGWICTNEEIEAATTLAYDHTGLELSPNSALALAGAMKASALGWNMPGALVCMIGGA